MGIQQEIADLENPVKPEWGLECRLTVLFSDSRGHPIPRQAEDLLGPNSFERYIIR